MRNLIRMFLQWLSFVLKNHINYPMTNKKFLRFILKPTLNKILVACLELPAVVCIDYFHNACDERINFSLRKC